MDNDILSTALTEAGLDEFFVDDSMSTSSDQLTNDQSTIESPPPSVYDPHNMYDAYPSVSYEGVVEKEEVIVTSNQAPSIRQSTYAAWETNQVKTISLQRPKIIMQQPTQYSTQQRVIATNAKTIIRTPTGKLMRVVPVQRIQATSSPSYASRNVIYRPQIGQNMVRHAVIRNSAPNVVSSNRLVQYRPVASPNSPSPPFLRTSSGVKFRPAYQTQQVPRRLTEMRNSSYSSLSPVHSPSLSPNSFSGYDYGQGMKEARSSPILNNNMYARRPDDPIKMKQQLEAQRRSKEAYAAKEDMKAAMKAGNELPEYEEESDNVTVNAETFVEYQPSKLRSGLTHPDEVVETVSLNSVQPPSIRYRMSIPEEVIDRGDVSALQLEAAIYACQIHEQRLPSGERTGYLIGDGAGVGKGRTIACIIYENYLIGRKKAIWLSVSNDLKYDAERDLRDIGATNVNVYLLKDFTYNPINSKENHNVKKGVMFITYSSLISESRGTTTNEYGEKSTIQKSRLKQLIQWFGTDYDGVIVFDECHKAKNLFPSAGSKPTKTGKVVLELQSALPNARIVYASATGATEPRNMAYMTRLGLWGSGQTFENFGAFLNVVETRGVGAMEMVAIDMKLRGTYLARQLSFKGASFCVEEVMLDSDFVEMYDDSVKFWIKLRSQFQYALNLLNAKQKSQQFKMIWAQFWAAHQRFFKYLCISSKVNACVRITKEALRQKKCVVIGLQSTGESHTMGAMEMMDELIDFVSTTKAVLCNLIDKHFPTGADGFIYPSTECDALQDMDRMFAGLGDSSGSRKRRFNDSVGMDLKRFKTHAYGSSSSKNTPVENSDEEEDHEKNTESEHSSNEDDETDDASDEESEEDEEEEEEDEAEKKDDLVNTLLAEIEDEDDVEADSENTDDVENTGEGEEEVPSQESGDINPFCMDFRKGHDPWARQQKIVEEKQKEKEKMERMKQNEKKEKRKKKKKKKGQEGSLKGFLKRNPMSEEREDKAQNADDFVKSTRLVEKKPEFSSPDEIVAHLKCLKTKLLTEAELLGGRLPANTLDHLIDQFGGPDFVAEMTGRRNRIVTRENGEIVLENRNIESDVRVEMMNMEEKDKFMKCEKYIAIISEAASSGISLQADRRAKNQRRRVHITLELPWSADKAVQQFGRTHRSNQVSAPEYLFLISELAGEKRFASIVAKRLASLGALTHGDRRATDSRDLSQFNIDTKYGRTALDAMLRTIIGVGTPVVVPPPASYKGGDFFEDMKKYLEGVGMLIKISENVYELEKDHAQITKFLNRILGLPVHAQNCLFQYFQDIISALIAEAKQDGTYDQGIMDLGVGGDKVQEHESREFCGIANGISFKVILHKIGVERGVSWEEALEVYEKHRDSKDGFYIHLNQRSKKPIVALIHGIEKNIQTNEPSKYCIIRPNTGKSPKTESYVDILRRFKQIPLEQAEKIWRDQYKGMDSMCLHKYLFNICRADSAHNFCEVGRRKRTYFVLSGSVLTVWPFVEEALNKGRPMARTSGSRMQVVRIRTESNQKIVGILVLADYVHRLVDVLQSRCVGINVENFLKQR